MSRERKKVLMAVAFVLAVVLCLSITSIAIADEVTAAAISKTLQMPIGTTTPTASFKFAVTGVSVNGDEDTKPPAVGGSFTIDFDALDTGIISGDVKTVVKESPSIFADTTFTSAGVYEYTVTETAGTWSTFRETMDYSLASYTLKVYVKDDGAAPNVIYIDNITATKTHNDAGDEVSAKVDPTPGDSEMVFVNTFIKQGTGTEPDPDDSSLIIIKTVSGDYASVTTPFSFSVMVTAPSLVSGSPTYHAYIMPAGTTQITFTSGVAETV
ncbi:MAG: hypothetical protein FWE87_02110, partial [Coriobacteriia bacterium]|nr:hypothetical protein [Coriobacteriia bacterium]